MSSKTVVLGGSGAMTSGCVYDLHQTSDFDEIVVADADEDNARRLVELVDDDRFRFEPVDATDTDDLVRVLEGAEYVVNGLPYPFEENVLDAMQEVGDLTGVDLNAFDFDEVLDRSEEFAEAGNALWFANGGLVSTIALGMVACEQFDDVEDVNFYWGMWRLLTQTTPGLTDTVTYEHNPDVDERAKWEDGEVINDLPAFSEQRTFEFPDPIGEEETYVISHPEPITFPKSPVAQEKNADRIITRGAWHDEWKRYERTLHAANAFETDSLEVDGTEVDPVEVMQEQVKSQGLELETQWKPPAELSSETEWTPQTILSAEVTGTADGQNGRAVFHFEQPFPFFDGNDITLMREYGCYVGVPLSVTLQLMADGDIDEDGIFITETSGLDADRYFEEMEARGFELTAEQTPNRTIPAQNQD
ncbi:saccharopine dehydrogenase family protein [Natronorubrum aibiense]|uniref:Saccharopine dehydrogenase n=1 Tax=Natronorubrum aibiense TaxID=348826 RepID=A0A5P9P9N6_9EURY|nr:saccharopine dehydrogenase NADP-binding domain-containing protein [Natronorubrum aibiense]QFU84717.1 saccharopine dehydrogenase [Natronorubrum aibiense]